MWPKCERTVLKKGQKCGQNERAQCSKRAINVAKMQTHSVKNSHKCGQNANAQ